MKRPWHAEEHRSTSTGAWTLSMINSPMAGVSEGGLPSSISGLARACHWSLGFRSTAKMSPTLWSGLSWQCPLPKAIYTVDHGTESPLRRLAGVFGSVACNSTSFAPRSP